MKQTFTYTKAANGCIITGDDGKPYVFTLDGEAAKHFGLQSLYPLYDRKAASIKITVTYDIEDEQD